jgi:hypothetical protein
MVHHLSQVTEKERSHVCTIDEHRQSRVEKVGTIHGDRWSEVRNRHSRHVYLILTQPALGSDAWVTQIFSLVHKKVLFGLLTFTVMDFNRPLAVFRRNTKEEATRLHAQIRPIVTQEKEDDWCAFLPAPTPPQGCTEAVQQRRSKHVGIDRCPSSEYRRTFRGVTLAIRVWRTIAHPPPTSLSFVTCPLRSQTDGLLWCAS